MATDNTDLQSISLSLDSGDREQFRFPENIYTGSISVSVLNPATERMREDSYVNSLAIGLMQATPTQIRRRRYLFQTI